MKHFAIIVAAGKSQRMNSDTPKQYLPLGDLTVLEHATQVFLKADCIEKIVIVLADDDQRFQKLTLSQHPKIIITIGGETRSEEHTSELQSQR